MIAILLMLLIIFSISIGFFIDISRGYLNIRSIKILLLSIFLSLTAMTVLIIPETNMDLYRYYNFIELYREYGWNYFILSLGMDIQWLFIIEMFFISKTNFNAIAPIIACIVVFSIFYYIFFDYIKDKTKLSRSFIMPLGLFFAWLPYFQIIDNLRSPMAMAICAMAVYQEFYKHKSKRVWFLYLIAFFIHMQSLIIFLSILAYKMYPKIYKYRFCFLVGFIIYSGVFLMFQEVSVPFVQTFVYKAIKYTSADYNSTILFNEFTISRIFMFIVSAIFMETTVKHLEEEDYNFARWLQIFIMFSVGCSPFAEVIRRFSYIMAFFSIMQINFWITIAGGMRSIFTRFILWSCILGMQVWALLKMSRFTLDGLDYSGIFIFLQRYINF